MLIPCTSQISYFVKGAGQSRWPSPANRPVASERARSPVSSRGAERLESSIGGRGLGKTYPYANHGAGIFTYKTGWFLNVGTYSSTMEHMGYGTLIWKKWWSDVNVEFQRNKYRSFSWKVAYHQLSCSFFWRGKNMATYNLVGGFNLSEKKYSQWEGLSHNIMENKTCSKPPAR